MSKKMNTTISISTETREILQEYGKKSENYDDIIRRMVNDIEMRDKIEELINENEYTTIEEAEEWLDMKIKLEQK